MTESGKNRLRRWDHPFAYTVAAFVLYIFCRSPFAGHWDSFDYLKQIVTHRLSDLGFGRPFFLAYNIILWEAMKKTFALRAVQVESVAIAATLLLGGAGVFLFHRFATKALGSGAARIAVAGFLLSPLYAFYSGTVMTEVPMMAALLGAACVLWKPGAQSHVAIPAWGGALFGVAVGIREQALSLGGSFLWMIWIHRSKTRDRFVALFAFALAALVLMSAPILPFYVSDPHAFAQRLGIWLHAIPMGQVHFWRNVEASLLFLFALCPAAWLALAITVIAIAFKRTGAAAAMSDGVEFSSSRRWCVGILFGLVIPLAILWRDADIQLHPRYALIALPAAILLCSAVYQNSRIAALSTQVWILLHVVVFAIALVPIQWFRDMQGEKRQFALEVRTRVPGPALLLAGQYSPIFDYYRAIGDRPEWEVVWAGWAWNRNDVARAIDAAWARGKPVYLCDDPWAWLYYEDQRLDLHVLLRDCKQKPLSGNFRRVFPREKWGQSPQFPNSGKALPHWKILLGIRELR